jgi:hypothetical protein
MPNFWASFIFSSTAGVRNPVWVMASSQMPRQEAQASFCKLNFPQSLYRAQTDIKNDDIGNSIFKKISCFLFFKGMTLGTLLPF